MCFETVFSPALISGFAVNWSFSLSLALRQCRRTSSSCLVYIHIYILISSATRSALSPVNRASLHIHKYRWIHTYNCVWKLFVCGSVLFSLRYALTLTLTPTPTTPSWLIGESVVLCCCPARWPATGRYRAADCLPANRHSWSSRAINTMGTIDIRKWVTFTTLYPVGGGCWGASLDLGLFSDATCGMQNTCNWIGSNALNACPMLCPRFSALHELIYAIYIYIVYMYIRARFVLCAYRANCLLQFRIGHRTSSGLPVGKWHYTDH